MTDTTVSQRPYVLVTNDDGVTAPGLAALIDALRDTCNLIVVAPDGPRSGAGCSITCTQPVSYRLLSDTPCLQVYACSGTPVDCVKMALDIICPRRPDMIVSGINLGNNASICTFYSGTVGAVIEGCIKGLPAVGFSLDTFDAAEANYDVCATHIIKVVDYVIKHGLPKYTFLNVNFPAIDNIKGLRVCRMAMGDWVKEYAPANNPRGGNHFWMTGDYELRDEGDNHDMEALSEGYASVVPQRLDMTDYNLLTKLSEL